MGACPLRRSLPDIVARDEDVISLLVEWLIRDKVSKMSREKGIQNEQGKIQRMGKSSCLLGVSVFRNTEPDG
jgi:hypothetical protein